MAKRLRAQASRRRGGLDSLTSGGRLVRTWPALLSARALSKLSNKLAGTGMAGSGILLIALAPSHRSPLWDGIFLVIVGVAEVSWSIAWLRRSSFALAWSGYLLGAYLIPVWILASLIGLGPGRPATVTYFGLAAILAALASLLSLSAVVVMTRPMMGRVNFVASAAVPAAVFGSVTYGLGLLLGLIASAS